MCEMNESVDIYLIQMKYIWISKVCTISCSMHCPIISINSNFNLGERNEGKTQQVVEEGPLLFMMNNNHN